MRTVKWNAFLSGLCGFAVALGVVASAGTARADVTIEKGASVLIFPKVVADSTFDTVIQITNTGNSMVHARCFYVNANLNWQETDFDIWLTKQQPTHWLVSEGRLGIPGSEPGTNDAGFTPGRVPPVSGFEGELKCVEVTASDEPFTGNHLKGEATISAVTANDSGDPSSWLTYGDVEKYNAVGILGNPDQTPSSNTLPLDGVVYDACPAKLFMNFLANGGVDPVVDQYVHINSSVNSKLTLVPCSEDFETQTPTKTTVQFLVTNAYEERFSASTTVDCYLSTFLTQIDSPTVPPSQSANSVFSIAVLGTPVATAQITPVTSTSGSAHAVVGILERVTSVAPVYAARSAYNLHSTGDLIPDTGPEQIVLSAP